MRYGFWEIFKENDQGRLRPTRPVSLCGITLSPGVAFGVDTDSMEFEIESLKGLDLEGDEEQGVLHITGYYMYAIMVEAEKH